LEIHGSPDLGSPDLLVHLLFAAKNDTFRQTEDYFTRQAEAVIQAVHGTRSVFLIARIESFSMKINAR
jgi:hypothetical protein